MIFSVTYGKQKKEIELLKSIQRDIAAYAGDDEWDIQLFQSMDEMKTFFEERPLLDLLCYEVDGTDTVSYLEKIRKNYQQSQLLLLADPKLCPMTYLRPGIMANALLLQPWTKEQGREILGEMISDMFQKQEGDSDSFIIKTKEGRTNIPYNQIYYFEAREKKLFVCTGWEEYGFYDTIENLQNELPEQFVRCHRSFIVNFTKIRKVMLSQNLIELTDGIEVPLSRSYKAVLKGMEKK